LCLLQDGNLTGVVQVVLNDTMEHGVNRMILARDIVRKATVLYLHDHLAQGAIPLL
jgi:hypothetical protein